MTVTVTCDNGVALVMLDRPATKNAISQAMRAQLWEAFEGFAHDSAIRAVVLTGAAGNFCSGMDVTTMGRPDVMGSMERMNTLQRISRAIYQLKVPTIAAVSGVCVGAGWSYALCCDFTLVSDTARFSQIFRNIGLAPDGGSVWLLRQQLGAMRAKEIVYSGRMIGSEEALSLGLALEKVSEGTLLTRAMELARDLAAGPTIAHALAKRQFMIAEGVSFETFLDSEYLMQPIAHRTADHQEGLCALREKRRPTFSGA